MKQKILTEQKINEIIEEELGIANDALELASKIEGEIYRRCETSNAFTFVVNDSLTVDFLYKNFDTAEEFSEWYDKTRRKSGYSYSENTMYINLLIIGDQFHYEELTDTIQHECLHYIECLKKGGPISTDKYQSIVNGIDNRNPVISTLCRVLYFANKNEINAYVNGTYASAMKKKKEYPTYKDFVADNSVNDAYTTLKNSGKILEKYNRNNPLFLTAMMYLIARGIIEPCSLDDAKAHIYKQAATAYKYLIRKIGMAYSLYRSKMEEEERIRDEANMRMLLKGGRP